MLPVFARLLLFADRPVDAAQLLVRREDAKQALLCEAAAGGGALDDAIRALANQPAVEAERQALWAKVDAAKPSPGDSQARPDAFTEATEAYRARTSVFLDVLDRYRLLSALREIGQNSGQALPAVQRKELEGLEALKESARRSLRKDGEARLRCLMETLRVPAGSEFAASCEPDARRAVVFSEVSRL
jgi:hypothetical protein